MILGLSLASPLWGQSIREGLSQDKPAAATEAKGEISQEAWDYVAGNLLTTFYHELGHALIDQLDLPVLGREEDAADSLSVVLTEKIWLEEWAQIYVSAQAVNYLLSADEAEVDEIAIADVHSLDLQRYYGHICLFYGANPEARAKWLQDFDLPEGRAENCPFEYEQAARSWQRFLDPLEEKAPGKALRFEADPADSISILIAQEVDDLNELFALPKAVDVRLQDCGEVNAFYDPQISEITLCTEYVDWLWQQAGDLDL